MAPRTDVFAGGWHFGWWLDKTRQELYHWVEPIIPDLDRSGQAWMVTVMFGVVDDLRLIRIPYREIRSAFGLGFRSLDHFTCR